MGLEVYKNRISRISLLISRKIREFFFPMFLKSPRPCRNALFRNNHVESLSKKCSDQVILDSCYCLLFIKTGREIKKFKFRLKDPQQTP
jgi:hypothetical protein